ncbi:hypothetical protein AXG93_3559s1030 [Marchantia polymorpha subsp. ruderalis]|uniref:Reverse transcriptase Ty1/copia-type domain-containing protein n=1 Tax=Marchantia polymorpha subsp. ruderalis TaxID=1480154 RepID=A0A176WKZ4_MARPO|nr:hypothetical protein AXG93_3559s1030 [Marchantia polymorpha subsp. ruderalis]
MEAQASVNKLEWNVDMERKMQSLIGNKTCEVVELCTDQTLIDFKWVYKLKDNPARDKARIFKDRRVARGFTQEKGVNYNKVFSPIAKFNMVDYKGVWTSLTSHFKLSATQYPTDAVKEGRISCVSYKQAVGNLMYLMVCTRPDIASAMGKHGLCAVLVTARFAAYLARFLHVMVGSTMVTVNIVIERNLIAVVIRDQT